jgi:hypothetical protein
MWHIIGYGAVAFVILMLLWLYLPRPRRGRWLSDEWRPPRT